MFESGLNKIQRLSTINLFEIYLLLAAGTRDLEIKSINKDLTVPNIRNKGGTVLTMREVTCGDIPSSDFYLRGLSTVTHF